MERPGILSKENALLTHGKTLRITTQPYTNFEHVPLAVVNENGYVLFLAQQTLHGTILPTDHAAHGSRTKSCCRNSGRWRK